MDDEPKFPSSNPEDDLSATPEAPIANPEEFIIPENNFNDDVPEVQPLDVDEARSEVDEAISAATTKKSFGEKILAAGTSVKEAIEKHPNTARTVGASVLATVAASTFATSVANAKNTNFTDTTPKSYNEEVDGERTVSTGFGPMEINGKNYGVPFVYERDTDTTTHSTHQETQTSDVDTLTVSTRIEDKPFAPEFSKSPEAYQTSDEFAVADIAKKIEAMEKDGMKITSITVQGYASDESHMRTGENPGLGIDDPENVELAATRGNTTAKNLQQELVNTVGDEQAAELAKKMNILPGIEIQDQKLNKAIEYMANKMAISPFDLIDKFNNGEDLPDDVVELLNGLKDDRYVFVTVEAEGKEAETTQIDVVDSQTNKKRLVIVPFIIPLIWKKKEKDATESDPKPDPEPTNDKPAPAPIDYEDYEEDLPPHNIPTTFVSHGEPSRRPWGHRRHPIAMVIPGAHSSKPVNNWPGATPHSTVKPDLGDVYTPAAQGENIAEQPTPTNITNERVTLPPDVKYPEDFHPKHIPDLDQESKDKNSPALSGDESMRSQFTANINPHRIQPRQYNMNPNSSRRNQLGDKMARSVGGNRSGKRQTNFNQSK